MVSVIIPTYKRPDKLKQAIKSVQSQTYDDLEIIIVDDNGEDNRFQIQTKKVMAEIYDERIVYICHKNNLGGCAARNTGIKRAKGEFIAFLDDDDVWSRNYIALMIGRFKQGIDVVYCDAYIYNKTFSVSVKKGKAIEGDVYFDLLKGWCILSTSMVVVRKSAFDKYGMFDENLKSFQDYDMWLTLSRNKCHFAFLPRIVVLKYEGIGEQVSVNPKIRRAGLNYFIKKWGPVMSGAELSAFRIGVERQKQIMAFNEIIYFRRHHKSIRKKTKKYLLSKAPIAKKIYLLLSLTFGYEITSRFVALVRSFLGVAEYHPGLASFDE
jgi:glycosyltransferase involved in cell wall biosynthesis